MSRRNTGGSSTSFTEGSGLCPHQNKAIQNDVECCGKKTTGTFRRVKILMVSNTYKDIQNKIPSDRYLLWPYPSTSNGETISPIFFF